MRVHDCVALQSALASNEAKGSRRQLRGPPGPAGAQKLKDDDALQRGRDRQSGGSGQPRHKLPRISHANGPACSRRV